MSVLNIYKLVKMSFLMKPRGNYKVATFFASPQSATSNYQTLIVYTLKCKCQESSFLRRFCLLPRHSQLICIAIMYSSSSLRRTALCAFRPLERCCDDDNVVVASSLSLTFSANAKIYIPIAFTRVLCGVFCNWLLSFAVKKSSFGCKTHVFPFWLMVMELFTPWKSFRARS